MKRPYILMLIALLSLVFAACQQNKPKRNSSDGAGFNLNGLYKITAIQGSHSVNCQTCSLKNWSTNDFNAYCSRLQNHNVDGVSYCAQEEREQWFRQAGCPGVFARDTSVQSCSNSATGRYEHTTPPSQLGLVNLSAAELSRLSILLNNGIVDSSYGGYRGFFCSTARDGIWKYNTLADYCSKLKDDALNAGCAHETRRELYGIHCLNYGGYVATNPTYRFDVQPYKGTFYTANSLFDWDKNEYDCQGASVNTTDKQAYCDALQNESLVESCFSHPQVQSYHTDERRNKSCF